MLIILLLWVVFGAIVGWIASVIAGTDDEQGAFNNITVGIAGAILGGFISKLLNGPAVTGFNLTSIVVATIGAVVLLFFIQALHHGASRE